ncbi:MAG: hypothetical protein GKR86_00015 [Ilumatobacter sp.]|nr:hypothetical protein [Ilumatobacter sp.]
MGGGGAVVRRAVFHGDNAHVLVCAHACVVRHGIVGNHILVIQDDRGGILMLWKIFEILMSMCALVIALSFTIILSMYAYGVIQMYLLLWW